jgi:hypothetical protein
MVQRIRRIVSFAAVLILFAGLRPAISEGWSLLNPFASESKTETKKKSYTKVTKKEPSVLDKLGTGTKNFFDKTGETLGLKKPEPKKIQYASPKPHAQAMKKAPAKSWLPPMFPPEEPKKPTTVTDWMGQPRQDL